VEVKIMGERARELVDAEGAGRVATAMENL
jgi:hypothetical protein